MINNNKKIETNIINSKVDVQKYILDLMKILKDIIGATMGPKGSYSLGNFDNNTSQIINDGATMINNMKFNGENAIFYNLILERIKASTQNINEHVGDGTSTCVVMIASLFEIASSYARIDSPVLLGKGMDLALERILNFIYKNNYPINNIQDIIDISKVSSRSLSIGQMIGNAVKEIGYNGNIICSEGNTINTSLEINKGFKIESGVISSSLLKQKLKLNMKFPLIFITDYVLSSAESILKILECHMQQIKKGDDDNLIIISKDIKGSALKILLAISQQKNIIAIKLPSFGDEKIARDICALTNSTFISKTDDINLENITIDMFGKCNDVETSLNNTTFVVSEDFNSNSIKARIDIIQNEINQETNNQIIKQLKDRIIKLSSGVANIKVGGVNEKNIKDQTYLVQDAISAVQSAIETGYVVGGGLFYMNIAEDLKIFLNDIEKNNLYPSGVIKGIKSVIEALYAPFKMIMSSTNLSFDLAMKELGLDTFDILQIFNLKTNYGFDADTLQFCNLLDKGIKEPAKVSEKVLINAISLVGSLLNTHSIILSNDTSNDNTSF